MSDSTFLYTDERLFRLIVQVSPAGMLIVNSQGRIIVVNERVLEYFGYEETELLGEGVEKLIPPAHHGVHATYLARYMSQPETRPMAAGRDLFAQRKDGTQFPVDISLHPLPTEGGVLVLANILDATDRRRAEREAERRQAMERLALLGQLAGGVAHEIRTPLCVIRNDVYFLQSMSDQLGPEGAECVSEINQAVAKANRIVSELLDFTRDPASHPEPVQAEAILAEALTDYSIPQGVEFTRPPPLDDVLVEADREQVARILTNLFRNAVQAMKGAGKLSVELLQEADSVVLLVRDSGPGIPADQRNCVFEPLFTTKPNGIGLGLAVSRRYAQRNGGQLQLDDSDSGGACFRLTLPKLRRDRNGSD